MTKIQIQPGHIARHTPQGAGAQGRGAAIIDVAQDLLLRHLSDIGLADKLAFKGGTSLRKLYAGSDGRFSLDLDFAIADINDDQDEIMTELVIASSGLRVGPFSYEMTERRGKWTVNYSHPYMGVGYTLSSKIDLNPAPWLEPVKRNWIPLPIHKQYGEPPLPMLKVIRLEENIAEKIARLNRTTTARDMYDLSWIMTTSAIARTLDTCLIRRLAVLKTWVDANGVHGGNAFWKHGHEIRPFDPETWLRKRSAEEYNTNDIGALNVPSPSFEELSATVSKTYAFMLDLDENEKILANTNGGDRPLALKMLRALPDRRLMNIGLY